MRKLQECLVPSNQAETVDAADPTDKALFL